MPKKPGTPQINSPTLRSLKEAWDKECNRLKWTKLRYKGEQIWPANLHNGLIARFLAEPDQDVRERIADEAIKEFETKWADSDDSTPPRLRGVGAVEHPTTERGPESPDGGLPASRTRKRH